MNLEQLAWKELLYYSDDACGQKERTAGTRKLSFKKHLDKFNGSTKSQLY